MVRLPPILIVDDEPDDVFIASRLLAKVNIKNPIISARDGEEAIAVMEHAMVDERLPRVVFLDIRMPRVDGFEVLRWIRRQAPLKLMPVVMFTTSCLEEELAKARALGASLWCEKFPSPQKLWQMVESC